MKSAFTHLAFSLAACIAALVGYGFWYAAVAEKSAAVTALQGQIDAKSEAVSRMATTRAALAEIAGDEAVVQSRFVPETAVVAFIDGLESRGRALGATLEVLSVSTGGAPARPTLVLSVAIEGTFDSVLRAVGAVEYAPYAISVSDLSVGRDDKRNWSANLKLVVASVPSVAVTKTP